MKELTLIMYLIVNGETTQEKVKMNVLKDRFVISCDSFTDSIQFNNFRLGNISFNDPSERVRIWEGKDNYVRIVNNKSGMVVFAGAKKGRSIVLKTK